MVNLANILVVDDDEKSRKAICAALTSAQHSTLEAKDGKDAQLTMKTEKVDLVISDIVMPEVDGLELLSWVKESYAIPVILMTGFSHILETQKAFELGADEFITKPFGYKDILLAINKVFNKRPSDEKVSSEKDTPSTPVEKQKAAFEDMTNKDFAYCRVPLEDFSNDNALELNIYVRLSAEKYLRIAHKGDSLPRERVDNYRRKGVDFLYARKDDFSRLVNFALDFSKIMQRIKFPVADKHTEFLKYTNELIVGRLFIEGFDKVIFDQACRNLQLCVSIISESETLFSLMHTLKEHADWVYTHSLGVGVCSTMISRKMGWNSMTSLFKVGTAAILHDVGKNEIEIDLLTKSRPLLSIEERRRIDYHPSLSRDILANTNVLPEEILNIVYQHHEANNGMGFPNKLKKDQIHPIARVIAVADRFCNYAIPNPHSTGSNAEGALKLVQENYADQLDPVAVGALKMLCARV